MSYKRTRALFIKENIENQIRLTLSMGNLNVIIMKLLSSFSDSDNVFQADITIVDFFSSLLKKSKRPIQKSLKALSDAGFIEKVDSKCIKVHESLSSKSSSTHYEPVKIEQSEEVEQIVQECMKYIPTRWAKIKGENEVLKAEITDLKKGVADLKDMLKEVLALMTDEQKEQVPHLVLVKNEE